MGCEVIDIYERPDFDIFICKVSETLIDERYLKLNGVIDYEKMAPILFASQKHYYKMGEEIKIDVFK